MKPTEYQRGKYRSLLKEIPYLEKQAAKRGWKWALLIAIIMWIVGFIIELIIERPTEVSVSDWIQKYNWLSLFTRVLFWTVIIYMWDGYSIRTELKSKNKELEGLLQKSPELKEEVQH
jgi:hypothetical protein